MELVKREDKAKALRAEAAKAKSPSERARLEALAEATLRGDQQQTTLGRGFTALLNIQKGAPETRRTPAEEDFARRVKEKTGE